MKTRSAFLFGAGATLDWNSPSTSELTEIILKSGFKTTDGSTTITRFIYDKLLCNGFRKTDVNFETIINVIEELSLYYSKYQSDIPHSLYSCFFKSIYETELLNYTKLESNNSSRFEMQIPKGKKYNFSKSTYYDQTPSQLFFQYLLQELLTIISVEITNNSFHSPGYSTVDVNCNASLEFIKWIQKKNQNSVIRMYTLNYDKIFKVLLKENGINLFDGFYDIPNTSIGDSSRANIQKILSDVDTNVYYNLHGSAFWQVRELDSYQLPHVEILNSYFPYLQQNDSPATLQIEKGKNILITNIVTGFQKAQRGMIPPYRQMQSSFDRDCCFAEELFIIGYSFSDEHINQSIKTALRHNKHLKVIIVDPNFIDNDMDGHFSINIFPFTDRSFEDLNPRKVKDNFYCYHGDTFRVYTQTFREFLHHQNLG